MARPVKEAVQREFAYWLATPKRLRVSLGLPVSERQFSMMKNVDVRTLRRWKEQKAFSELVESFKLEMANSSPDSAISRIGLPAPIVALDPNNRVKPTDDPVFDAALSRDEQRYLQVKDTLVQMAVDGNQGAMDLYLKHYGKSFIESEQSDYTDYQRMSDEQLITELCAMVGVESVSEWLASQAAAEV